MVIENLDKNAIIKWRITDLCNFNCPYCIRRDQIHNKTIAPNSTVFEIIRIAHELFINTGKKVKIDLIGGEVTVIPLDFIKELYAVNFIEKVNITTNMERYWVLKDIADEKLTLTCSYHPTQTSMDIDTWFKRAKDISLLVRYLKVETVLTKESSHIPEFISKANEYGLDYQVEEDLQDPSLKGLGCSSTKKNYRYKVTIDGNVSFYKTRNSFLKANGINGQVIKTDGLLCSRDYDYVYIDQDQASFCTGKHFHISKFHVQKGYHPCFRGNSFCTLCGNISIRQGLSPQQYNSQQ